MALLRFVDAVMAGHAAELQAARTLVIDALGAAALTDVCATIASFCAVVKLADGTGIPLEAEKEARTHDMRSELALDRLRKS